MPKVIGNFYFKLTTAGNLLGEYSNSDTPRARPECAFRDDNVLQEERQTFEGTFTSTWYEPDSGSAEVVTLTITPRGGTTGGFDLTWSAKNGRTAYSGEAMLNDGQLVGKYWSVD